MSRHDRPAIDVQGLEKNFGQVRAVHELSLRVMPGEIFGIVGPDGAGKTTTLRLLATILPSSSGTATVAGFDTRTHAVQVKDRIAYMSQRFGLYPDLTVQENIDFYADLYGEPRRGRQQRIAELLDFSSMGPFRRRLAGNLSGGMKQKLQLVCALIHTPEVLLLDEPTNGVDPVSRRDFWRILYRLLKDRVAILVTTSYLDEAERCSRIGLLHEGGFMATGTPEELRRLLPGHILSIRSPKARTVRNMLGGLDFLSGTEVFGDRVHAQCTDIARAERGIRELLNRHQVPVDEIREEPPSLEDLFVGLLSKNAASRQNSMAPLPTPSPEHDHTTAVSVQRLTRRFGSFTAVRDISFSVPRGEIFGFLGPNGAGKSTTIRMLCGLLTPSEGSGTVNGFDITREPESIKRHIGYMSQKFSLYEDLTVQENIAFYGGIYGLSGKQLEKRSRWAVTMSGLTGREANLTRTLAAGFKQRLAMACAVLHEPPILFLDEPTSGVDPLSRRRFWDLITSMAESGVTVFVTTHYMEEAEYCDRIALIYRGEMIALGTPTQLKRDRMQDLLLNLSCSSPQDILDEILSLPEVRDAALFGAGLHITVHDETEGMRAIRKVLDNTNRTNVHLERITPSMEDVFVSLIEETDRNREQAS